MRDLRRVSAHVLLIVLLLAVTRSGLGQGGTIVNASYGAGNRQVNVTSQVQSLVRKGWLNFQVTNQIFGVRDPAVGMQKQLSIDVQQWNGQTRNYRFNEWSQVSLQVGGPANQGSTIISASYGHGRNRVNVTPQVQSLVQNGALNFRVTNDIIGIDDPAPGRVKDLRIRVRQGNGQTRDYQFQEKGQVNVRLDYTRP